MQLFKRPMGKRFKAKLTALAEGIECGAKLRPKAVGGLLRPLWFGEGGYGSCALGAAMECALIRENVPQSERMAKMSKCTDYDEILALYGLEDRTANRAIKIDGIGVVVDADEEYVIATLIYRLNDTYKWDRERIAQFLRDAQ